ncbi:MAG: preprotein translocase subunit SecY [Candidatus Omnitrophica bacterium CG11_big_fil_rev_8_21_14_0_20_64_10]|nr:MAG: preprotein translocase subunit SecY [Candidatus Omnitrophica bacterium CG11_big_fil_rev_8_21_14_0_20_64_10]
MWKAFANSWKVPELRRRAGMTFALIAVYRAGAFIPLPGIDGAALTQFFDTMTQQLGETLFTLMDLFSGGSLSGMTIFALGIMPTITASIIMQLLIPVFPRLEHMVREEGESGRRTFNQWTRYLTVGLGLMQSLFISLMLENPANFGGQVMVAEPGWAFRIVTIITLTSGTAFIMWLGEQISAYGIGNGMSILITAGILSSLPTAVRQLWKIGNPLMAAPQIPPATLVFMLVMLVAVVLSVIAITQAQRRVPIQYARRVVGRKVYGGQTSYLPIRVNAAGVLPIIFAQSFIMMPATLFGFTRIEAFNQISHWLSPGGWIYMIFYPGLIIFFSYFYAVVQHNPLHMAEDMKKYGGFVPGIRPGKATAEFFDRLITRITLPGAIFLAIIAVIPILISRSLGIPGLIASFFGGTSLLIVVGVTLDTLRQAESFLLMRNYEGFLTRGRLRARR